MAVSLVRNHANHLQQRSDKEILIVEEVFSSISSIINNPLRLQTFQYANTLSVKRTKQFGVAHPS